MDGADLLGELARRVEAGEEVVLATAVRIRGAPPCHPGNKLLVGPAGPLAGTLGCSELDAQAIGLAGPVLASGEPTLSTLTHDLGEIDAHLEPYRPSRRLVVVSATPVALHLLRLAPALGYATVLVEDRSERVTPEHRQWAGRVVAGLADLGLGLGKGGGSGADTAAVCTDHDAPGLPGLLAALLEAGVRHLAVMGSARHTGPHLEALRSLGFDAAAVFRVRTPAGLDIGARTPAEIALSILAGVMADRAGRDGLFLDRKTPGRSAQPLSAPAPAPAPAGRTS